MQVAIPHAGIHLIAENRQSLGYMGMHSVPELSTSSGLDGGRREGGVTLLTPAALK